MIYRGGVEDDIGLDPLISKALKAVLDNALAFRFDASFTACTGAHLEALEIDLPNLNPHTIRKPLSSFQRFLQEEKAVPLARTGVDPQNSYSLRIHFLPSRFLGPPV
jgi:hypothetical protein